MTSNDKLISPPPVFRLIERHECASLVPTIESYVEASKVLRKDLPQDSVIAFCIHYENQTRTQWFMRFSEATDDEDDSWFVNEAPLISLTRTRRTRNAVERFRGMINWILCMTRVGEVCLDVLPNDLGAIDLCGRWDLSWSHVLLRYNAFQTHVSASPRNTYLIHKPTMVPMSQAAIYLRCCNTGQTRADCDRSDIINFAIAMSTVANGFPLPLFVMMWIFDWLPEMATQNDYLKMTCFKGVEESIKRCAERRSANDKNRKTIE